MVTPLRIESRSNRKDGLDLNASPIILYKFYVRDRTLVPPGLREGQPRSNWQTDRQHAEEAEAAGLGNLAIDGRVRPGRTDTGKAVYQNENRVQIGSVRALLAREGYYLVDACFFEKPSKGVRPSDFVISLTLSSLERDSARKLPRPTMDALRKLARENTWTAHVWDNTNLGNPATVNFTSRQQGKPSGMLVVRGNFLQLVNSDGENAAVVEQREEREIARELIEAFEELE